MYLQTSCRSAFLSYTDFPIFSTKRLSGAGASAHSHYSYINRSHTNWLYCAYWLHWLKYLWAQPQTRVADWSTAQYLNCKTWHQEQPSKLRGDAVLSICLSDWEDLKPWAATHTQPRNQASKWCKRYLLHIKSKQTLSDNSNNLR